jgi:hypothetical protein
MIVPKTTPFVYALQIQSFEPFPHTKQQTKRQKTDPKKRKPPKRANCYCCHLDSLETLTKPKSQEPIASQKKKD